MKRRTNKPANGSPNPVDINVGIRMRARRIQLGLSQGALAYATGITYQQVQKYEHGLNRVSASRLFDLCSVMNVTVQYFFDGMDGTQPSLAQTADVFGSEHSRSLLELIKVYKDLSEPMRLKVTEIARAMVTK